MDKASKTIVSVLALAAVVAVGLVLVRDNKSGGISSSKNVTEDWKVYRDEIGGYSIMYPEHFNVWQTDFSKYSQGNKSFSGQTLISQVYFSDKLTETSVFIPNKLKDISPNVLISITVYDNPKLLSLEEWASEHTSYVEEETPFNINGINAIRLENRSNQGDFQIIVPRNNTVINFSSSIDYYTVKNSKKELIRLKKEAEKIINSLTLD